MQIIKDISEIGRFLTCLNGANEVALDIETSSLDPFTLKMYLLQLCIKDEIFVFDLLKFNKIEYILHLIQSKLIVGHNLNFDLKAIFVKTGIEFRHVYDTELVEVILFNGIGKKFYSLLELVDKYCGVTLDKDVREEFYKNGDLDQITDELYVYSALDVKHLFEVKNKQEKEIEKKGLLLTHNLEMRVVQPVISMETNGITLDTGSWNTLMLKAVEIAKEKENLIKQLVINKLLKEHSGISMLRACELLHIPVKTKNNRENFAISPILYNIPALINLINIGSPLQVKSILNLFGIIIDSTGEKELEDLNSDEQIIKLLLEFREYSKKGSSFGKSFIKMIHPVTGKIHTRFMQLQTDSGRFASSKPNMHQIPRESDYRHCFIAEPGYILIICDYSQQELRIAGSLTGETKFIEAYRNNIDIHALTGSLIFGIDIQEVTPEQRQIAKGFNFAVLYGSSEYGLAYTFNMPIKTAKELLDKFYEGYPILYAFKKEIETYIYKYRYATTLSGRKRFFAKKEFYAPGESIEKEEQSMYRQGFNHMIQGTGADMLKEALCTLYYDNPFGDDFKILLNVHDEIVVMVKEEIQEEARVFVEKSMLDAERLYVKNIEPAVKSTISKYWSK